MTDDPVVEARPPGESPCSFVHGLDGWTNCAIHGWTGPREQRSRVLVCPEAAAEPAMSRAYRETIARLDTARDAVPDLDGFREEVIQAVGEYDHQSEVESGHSLDPEAIGNLVYEIARVRFARAAVPPEEAEFRRRMESCTCRYDSGVVVASDPDCPFHARAAVPEPSLHPGEPHEFRTTCQRCGESGYLHVALITDGEVVKVEDRAALAESSEPDGQEEGWQ